LLAGRGDIKRFFDHLGKIKIKAGPAPITDVQFQTIWREIQSLQAEYHAGIFGQGSIFAKTIKTTLGPEQIALHENIVRDRIVYRYWARVDVAMERLNNLVGFTQDQHERLVKLLAAETRPPKSLGNNEYWAVLYLLSTLPEAKVKPIFDDVQYRYLKRHLDAARGLGGAWLKQTGFVPDDAKANAADEGPVQNRPIRIQMVPMAPAPPRR